MNEEQARHDFQAHLSILGYEIEQTNPLFVMLFDLYRDGTLYQMWLEEFGPVMIWNKQAEALLAPYKVMRGSI